MTIPVSILRAAVEAADRASRAPSIAQGQRVTRVRVADGTLHVVGGSDDLIVTTTAPVDHPAVEAVVVARDLAAAVGAVRADAVELSTTASGLILRAGTMRTRLVLVADADAPGDLALGDDAPSIELPADQLVWALGCVSHAMDDDTSRPQLCAVRLEIRARGAASSIVATATDGCRLARATVALDAEHATIPAALVDGVLIPSRAVGLIGHLLGAPAKGRARIRVTDRTMSVTTGQTTVQLALLGLAYPTIGPHLLLSDAAPLRVDRLVLVDALRAASGMSTRQHRAIDIDVDADAVACRVSARDPDRGEYEQAIDVEPDAPEVRITVRDTYILGALTVLGGHVVEIRHGGGPAPIVMVEGGEDRELRTIVMPMRRK